MKKFYELYKKVLWIEIKGDKIIDVSCSCEDFVYRKLKKKDDKVVATGLCKHLNRLIGTYYGEKEVSLDGKKGKKIKEADK